MFKHFVFTRYNYGLYDKYDMEKSREWMYNRESLFSQLVDSMMSQTCQNFTWVISMDYRTPKDYLKDFKDSLLDTGLDVRIIHDIHQIWINDQNIEEEWILTSRIDNDDVYYTEFIEKIQEDFLKDPSERVVDVCGVQVDAETEDFYTSGRRRPNSPFVTLFEPNRETLNTVYKYQHTFMPDHYQAKRLPYLGYIQVIHPECQMNKIIGDKIENIDEYEKGNYPYRLSP